MHCMLQLMCIVGIVCLRSLMPQSGRFCCNLLVISACKLLVTSAFAGCSRRTSEAGESDRQKPRASSPTTTKTRMASPEKKG